MQNYMEVQVCLLGQSNVGKSCLLRRVVENYFDNYEQTTVGSSFQNKLIQIDNQYVRFQIWDTAGQEKYRSLANLYYKNAQIALLVYDVSDKKSFEELNSWLKELKEKAKNDIYLCILGNKMDKEDKQVSYDEAVQLSVENNALFRQVSAKDGTNVDQLFIQLAKKYLKRNQISIEKNQMDTSYALMKSSVNVQQKDKKKKCC